jgi:hypothetical protein
MQGTTQYKSEVCEHVHIVVFAAAANWHVFQSLHKHANSCTVEI